MSGYLSRMIQAAGSSRQPLRPLAGSVLAGPISDAHAELERPSHLKDTPFVIDEVVPAQQSETSAASARRPAAANLSPEARMQNYQPLQPLQQPARQSPPESFAPVDSAPTPSYSRPQSAEILPASPAANRLEPVPEIINRAEKFSSPRTSGPSQSGPAAPDSSHREKEPASHSESVQPFAGLQFQIAAPPQLIPAQTAPMTRQQQPLRDQRLQSPQQSGVEIHIGRIEVLAVPPPTPPAPAPRRNPTTSLADYLAGRNGRRS